MSRWKQGQSGNPAGKPKGTINPSTKLRRAIAADLPDIITRMVEAARGGDVQAATLLISRVLPAARQESDVQAIHDGGSMIERAEQVVVETLAGNVSPTAAGELMALIAGQARIVEVAELEARIAALEGRTS